MTGATRLTVEFADGTVLVLEGDEADEFWQGAHGLSASVQAAEHDAWRIDEAVRAAVNRRAREVGGGAAE